MGTESARQRGGGGEGRPGSAPNMLADQTSPYLLQHAYNPVNWRPWGEEAFDEARRRDVPMLVSIGYATCYWCHVMERESFEDDGIARLMNDNFVCVKVDREERPDVDDVYMTALQVLTGTGGWPLNVFVEPGEHRPFWAGTYFPAVSRPEHGGRPSWPQVLDGIARAWREKRQEALMQAEHVAGAVAEHLSSRRAPVFIGAGEVGGAVSSLLTTHDRANGGFGGAPKFPQPSYLDLLLAFRQMSDDAEAVRASDAAVRRTLDAMATGGLFDQVGGGFHRYSTDQHWLVPHFEKMLYDNAHLAAVYAQGAAVYEDPFYARVARRTLDHVLREMTSPQIAFFSAQDAEVDGREGGNYVWTAEQVRAALEPEDAEFACAVYGLDRGPNFRDPHHSDAPPVNVLRLGRRPEAIARERGETREEVLGRLDRVDALLYEARSRREQPRTDDKVLTGWNGLMIAGLAVGAGLLGEAKYMEAAQRAARFILGTMRDGPGEHAGLLRSYRAGSARVPGFLEDYALLIHGLLAIVRHGGDRDGSFLRSAAAVLGAAESRFAGDDGGYFDTLEGQSDLFVRARTLYDGATPCGTSVMINNLVDLHEITGEGAYLERAARALASISGFVHDSPVAACNSTRALARALMIDSAAVASALPPPGEAAAAGPTEPAEPPVRIYANTDRVQVGPEEPVGVVLRFEVDEPYHIIAADPGVKGLVPLRVGVTHGGGVAVYANYPEGEPMDGGPARVNRGQFELSVVIEREGQWRERPILTVTYQACTDEACLEPTIVELDVVIDRK